MSLPKPSVGRIVHYTTGRMGACEAAIVSAVMFGEPTTIRATVFGYSGPRVVESLTPVDPSYPDGEPDIEGWHWPEREA